MQQHKKALDRVARVRHMVAMIVQPSKTASPHVFEDIMRNLSWVAKHLRIHRVF